MQVTSCSPGGALQPRRVVEGDIDPGSECAEVVSASTLALQRLTWACRRQEREAAHPQADCSCPVLWAGSLSCVLCVLVKQKLVANSITNVLVCVQFLEHYKGFVCLAVNKKKT